MAAAYNSAMSVLGVLRYVKSVLMGGAAMLKPGDPAPEFEASDHLGRPVRLADFRGRNLVLWFFPKADTPG
jgi:peroxiredoxin